ncbi:MAG: glutamine--fructose-6-phosphate transaminase (isomerizing) [Candidatus Omnitrophica bacterium]|nr:glutamine--fructose-6-phosphate transaminase (isomerizing) [Candidatus Omnitrophota bacterium]MBU0878890.1 glutamine--fructose-6-phosphate transaminase (isomerizing) [Candidatus Omnitrophota bacterium]MBU1134017.1 glutamine--fructose-6-phosphate transaminase (isomerizing) [Candidatus Omnitrophota bacterium]MBU1810823.1 glutamine--fructose-6-phosphate transaminase (isomerizing) [Candidatus Omnitrophota bacterium]
MCGIIGYIGSKDAVPILAQGLKNLEYRGYDSAGIVTIYKGKLATAKCKGRIADLKSLLKKKVLRGNVGLGHTRWATHGVPSVVNAHPHLDCSGKISVVHNGIIENFQDLKENLKKQGCKIKSQTDTEVAAHLISKLYKGNLEAAVRGAVKKIKGSFALGVISSDEPGKIVAARRDSPLVVGLGSGENFIASDVAAILNYTKQVIYLEDNQMAVITKDSVNMLDMRGNKVNKDINTISYRQEDVQKRGFSHFMAKEIHEQPQVLSRIISCCVSRQNTIRFKDFNLDSSFLKKVENIIIIACGTAYHAGLVGKYIMESFLRIPTSVDYGSEFRYRKPVIRKNSLVIAISQSGETADTLAGVREAKKSKVRVLSICNVLGSSLTRESDSVIYTHAGPEISVASTKAYTAQIMTLYFLGLYLANLRNSLSKSYINGAIASLKKVPTKQREILQNSSAIKAIAKKHLHFGAFLYLGRNINFPTALEGALKLKEISYIPAEGYAAGEMKHGPIALIDEYRAVVCIANNSFVFDKMVSNIQETLARKGKIIAIATQGNKQLREYLKEIIFIPPIEEEFSPLLTIIPLQLLAYYIAVLKGYDVDKPRNLAKSVTVE